MQIPRIVSFLRVFLVILPTTLNLVVLSNEATSTIIMEAWSKSNFVCVKLYVIRLQRYLTTFNSVFGKLFFLLPICPIEF